MKARVVLLVAILGTSAVGAANSGKKRMREETSTEAETDTDTDEDGSGVRGRVSEAGCFLRRYW